MKDRNREADMRKQNSAVQTAFLSEAGSELENKDYFAFVELEQYACYVIADGFNELPNTNGAKLAIETVLLEFQEHPSIRKRALRSYLKAANQALCKSDQKEHLKASIMVIVSDYQKIRYAYAGNARFRFYRNGIVKEQSKDTSLSSEIGKRENIPEDRLSKHEERNNLYSYVGQGKGFSPVISHKIKLENGDILALYTRGIWENLDSGELDDVFSEAKKNPQENLDQIEDLLLSRQPKVLENYTFAVIFIDKVFLDPKRKKRIKKIVMVCIILLLLFLAAFLVWYFLCRRYKQLKEDFERSYLNTIEYIQDTNFIRAKEEGSKALEYAEKLRDKELVRQISDYLKLIEAVNLADNDYQEGEYQKAQEDYKTAKERSRYADQIADAYIDQQLSNIADYRSVFDLIQLGDMLMEQEDYKRAEEKYLQAKKMAAGIYFEDGRKDAMTALEKLYSKWEEAENQKEQESIEAEAQKEQEAEEHALIEVSAVKFATEGDQAFQEGDYSSASAYYHMALEKYQELEDEVHSEWIQEKIDASVKKEEEREEKVRQAALFLLAGREQEDAKNYLEAKKQYLFARKLYRELGMEDKVLEIDGLLSLLEEITDTTAETSELSETSEDSETETESEKESDTIPEMTPAEDFDREETSVSENTDANK